MQITFLLLDLENVQPNHLPPLGSGAFKIKVFLGSHQTKLPVSLVRALQVFGPDVDYIQMDGAGHNALDFHIAYYLGRLAVEHPKAHFHIISKDAGFDPLVGHLRTQNVVCSRHPSIAALGGGPASAAKQATDRAALVIANLRKLQAAKPRTLKTLGSSIQVLFKKALTDLELQELIGEMTQNGVIKVSEGKLSYTLPES